MDVDCFVNISTDKAANPISALGWSKRIGEHLVANAATEASGTFLSVHFGTAQHPVNYMISRED